jgi:hypothetical protein
MTDLQDYELDRTPGESSPPRLTPARPTGVRVAAAVLVAAAGAAAYLAFVWRPGPAPASAPQSTTSVKAPTPPLGGTGEDIPIPPLDASDAVVRTLVRALSEHPAVVAWLATNGLIRNFTVVVANLADGGTPAKHLNVLRPSSAFRIVERDGNPMWTTELRQYAGIADDRLIASEPPPPASMRPSSPHRGGASRAGSSIDPSTRPLNARSSPSSTRIVDGPVAQTQGIGICQMTAST